MDTVKFYLEAASQYFRMGLEAVESFLSQYVFSLTDKWLGVLVCIAILALGFGIRGLIRSFVKNPRTTIFFIVLFAICGVAWYVLCGYLL